MEREIWTSQLGLFTAAVFLRDGHEMDAAVILMKRLSVFFSDASSERFLPSWSSFSVSFHSLLETDNKLLTAGRIDGYNMTDALLIRPVIDGASGRYLRHPGTKRETERCLRISVGSYFLSLSC